MMITLYSTHCPKCNIIEKKLNDKGIKFDEVNDVEIMQAKGFLSLPVLDVDGEVMDFVTANKWVNEFTGDTTEVTDFHCDTCEV